MQDRRTALKVIGATAAALPVLAQEHANHEVTTKAVKYVAKVFDKDQLALLSELTDCIIPRTATPGAADAQVPLLIDRTAHASPAAAAKWKDLLAWYSSNGKTPEDRLELLKRGSTESNTEAAANFKLLKDTTIDRYYGTREGLVDELGWHGNTYLPEFKGCTHSEHQS